MIHGVFYLTYYRTLNSSHQINSDRSSLHFFHLSFLHIFFYFSSPLRPSPSSRGSSWLPLHHQVINFMGFHRSKSIFPSLLTWRNLITINGVSSLKPIVSGLVFYTILMAPLLQLMLLKKNGRSLMDLWRCGFMVPYLTPSLIPFSKRTLLHVIYGCLLKTSSVKIKKLVLFN